MCTGNAARQAHHASEQAKREAAQIVAANDKRYEAMQQQADAIKPKVTPPPVASNSTIASTGGVKTAASKRKSVLSINKGIAALRNPLNTGGSGSNSNVNIG